MLSQGGLVAVAPAISTSASIEILKLQNQRQNGNFSQGLHISSLLLLLLTFSRRESGALALPVSGACAHIRGERLVLLLAGSGGLCPHFRARGGLSCSL